MELGMICVWDGFVTPRRQSSSAMPCDCTVTASAQSIRNSQQALPCSAVSRVTSRRYAVRADDMPMATPQEPRGHHAVEHEANQQVGLDAPGPPTLPGADLAYFSTPLGAFKVTAWTPGAHADPTSATFPKTADTKRRSPSILGPQGRWQGRRVGFQRPHVQGR